MAHAGTIQSLARGLKLLDLMVDQPYGCSVKWLSAVSGIPLGTCYHLVNTLVDAGYLDRDKTAQTYTISYKLIALTQRLQDRWELPYPLTQHAYQLMERLSETTYLATWSHEDVVVRYIAEGNQAIKVRSLYVGFSESAWLHALGRAVLAYLSPERLDRYRRGHPIVARTPRSPDPDAIMRELVATSDRGYAQDVEEFEMGLCCLAAPIFQADGSIWGSLAVALPESRYGSSVDQIIDAVVEGAQAVSQYLGYSTAMSVKSPG